jgi:hypothetical protein
MKGFEALVPRCRDAVTDMHSPPAAEASDERPTGASLGIDGPFGVLPSSQNRSAAPQPRCASFPVADVNRRNGRSEDSN